MATRSKTSEASVESNGSGFNPAAARQLSEAGIPSKRGRARNEYPEWAPEIQFVRDNLGHATCYEGVPNVVSLAQGIRRQYGVIARTRDLAEDKSGTLWLEYPSILLDEVTGERMEDTDTVAKTQAKYSK